MEKSVIEMKVCGMRDQQNILDVSHFQPDYMGFIFYAASPRYVGDDFSIPALPGSVKKVGVFVNESTERILDAAKRFGLHYIQ